jgi:tetratricopeptide (TPR) repeat protein
VSAADNSMDVERFHLGLYQRPEEDKFKVKMNSVLAAIVFAATLPVVRTPGKDLVRMLAPIAGRLEELANSPLEFLGSEDRVKFLRSYGRIEFALGRQSGKPEHLDRAERACTRALEECSRANDPLDWSAIQKTLGNIWMLRAEQKDDNASREKARQTYLLALAELTPEREKLEYATTLNNLGVVLARLGECGGGSIHLRGARMIFREALRLRTVEDAPLQRAYTLSSLAGVLKSIAESEGDPQCCREAIAVSREALQLMDGEDTPIRRADVYHNLGNALLCLGTFENDIDLVRKSILAYRVAAEIGDRQLSLRRWGLTQKSLALAFIKLSELEPKAKTKVKHLMRARTACYNGFTVFNEVLYPREYSDLMAILARINALLEKDSRDWPSKPPERPQA